MGSQRRLINVVIDTGSSNLAIAGRKVNSGYEPNGNGQNCICGRLLQQYETGHATADLCADACATDTRCRSFGVWTSVTSAKGKGRCALFASPCVTNRCPKSTDWAAGETNTVYNLHVQVLRTYDPAQSNTSASVLFNAYFTCAIPY